MDRHKDIGGIAILCDRQGIIRRVVRDELGLADRLSPGQAFVTLVDDQSVEKAQNFLAALRAQGAAFDWRLNLPVGQYLVSLYFAGSTIDDHLFIAGADSLSNVSRFYDELMQNNNDQQNPIRTVLKDLLNNQSDQLYVELSRLNNDLVTTQRELTKKISELEKLAVENARLYHEAQEALRIRNEFLSVITHDLKTPITSIKGYAQLLKRRFRRIEIAETPQLIDAAGQIERIALKMTGQINELLDIARLQMGQSIDLDRQLIDLVALTRQVVTELQPVNRRPELIIETTLDELVGLWDTVRLERMLTNLLSNAIKYSPHGGVVRISIAQEIDADPPGEWAVLEVRDQGIGIPAADLPYIFEPFRRSKNSAHQISGTGIGLTSTRQIVEQHGGTIQVASKENQGTTFTVRLPLMPPTSPSQRT